MDHKQDYSLLLIFKSGRQRLILAAQMLFWRFVISGAAVLDNILLAPDPHSDEAPFALLFPIYSTTNGKVKPCCLEPTFLGDLKSATTKLNKYSFSKNTLADKWFYSRSSFRLNCGVKSGQKKKGGGDVPPFERTLPPQEQSLQVNFQSELSASQQRPEHYQRYNFLRFT